MTNIESISEALEALENVNVDELPEEIQKLVVEAHTFLMISSDSLESGDRPC